MTDPAANTSTSIRLAVIVLVMFGFGFAMVPFYKKLCEVAGLNSIRTDAAVQNTQVDRSRWVTIEFDSNVNPGLPWRFKPARNTLRIHPGEIATVEYEVSNLTDRPVTGQAIPSYGPALAQSYFRKIDCFCFRRQVLAAGETRRMPVVFIVGPDLPAEVNTITLSYTFFAAGPQQPGAAGQGPNG